MLAGHLQLVIFIFIDKATNGTANMQSLGTFILWQAIGLTVTRRLYEIIMVVFVDHYGIDDFAKY